MIRISQLKLSPDHTPGMLRSLIAKRLHLPVDSQFQYEIVRWSVDARKKPIISYVYTVDVQVSAQERLFRRLRKDANITLVHRDRYQLPEAGAQPLLAPPVVVGSGPAGVFCTLMLAKAGFRPILLERGDAIQARKQAVETFWQSGKLDPESNVQFGEGGAGTFSDGKLNTLIKDTGGRIREVYETFVRCGANPDILSSYKPHIGTDVLSTVVERMRREITALGGSVRFRHRLEDFRYDAASGWYDANIQTPEGEAQIRTQALVLALGHSARDTFSMLSRNRVAMEMKAFAVGVRIQHPQQMINDAMYGAACPYELDAAPYKLTARVGERGVYSFCMCPGGYVVNASSEEGYLAVNGMSERARDTQNANSAIVVTISPEQYGGKKPLDGITFQRSLERKAYLAAGGAIPLQTFRAFAEGVPQAKISSHTGTDLPADFRGKSSESIYPCDLTPVMKGSYAFGDVRGIFPEEIADTITQGIRAFGKKIPGFDADEVLLAGVESRTSSPVRILRGEDRQSISHPGLYPCGEGAGYAGGITSAAVDGMKTAEVLIARYHP